MFYIVLLIIFLIQFLVALGALMFVIFLARPEVPLSGDGALKKTCDRDRLHPHPPEEKGSASGKNGSRQVSKPPRQVLVTRPATLAAFAFPPAETLPESAPEWPSVLPRISRS